MGFVVDGFDTDGNISVLAFDKTIEEKSGVDFVLVFISLVLDNNVVDNLLFWPNNDVKFESEKLVWGFLLITVSIVWAGGTFPFINNDEIAEELGVIDENLLVPFITEEKLVSGDNVSELLLGRVDVEDEDEDEKWENDWVGFGFCCWSIFEFLRFPNIDEGDSVDFEFLSVDNSDERLETHTKLVLDFNKGE